MKSQTNFGKEPITKRRRRGPADKDYINNKEFTALIVQETESNRNNSEHKICKRLLDLFDILIMRMSEQSNFRNYPFLIDMKQEALLDCIQAIRRCNFKKGKLNGFCYFFQVVKCAFIRVIKEEKHQLLVKNECGAELIIMLEETGETGRDMVD